MKSIQITGEEWSQFKYSMELGDRLTDTYVVLGPSKEIGENVQALLESAVMQRYHVSYNLCSGSRLFHIPCYYDLFAGEESPCEVLQAGDVLEQAEGLLTPGQAVYSPLYAVGELQRHLLLLQSPLILIECITSPTKSDITFIQQVLIAMRQRQIPVMIFLHQHDANEEGQPLQDCPVDHEHLLLLYMCGGRMRETEWRRLTGQNLATHLPAAHTSDQLVACRQIGQHRLFCYTHRAAAEIAEQLFLHLTDEKKQEIAEKVLQILPSGSSYPLFAIACLTNKINTILSLYSRDVLRTSFSDPACVLSYFRHLRRVARTCGNAALAAVASINYVAALLCLYSIGAGHLYRALQRTDFSTLNKDTVVRLWFTLGQLLSKAKERQQWEYASECYRRCRVCLEEISDMPLGARHSRLAAIANGEALVALKLRQRDQARELEEFALAEVSSLGSNPDIVIQQVLLRTNLGELQLRMFNDRDAAIVHYEAAYALALTCSSLEARGYVIPKLVKMLTQVKRFQDGIGILHDFLMRLRRQTTTSTSPLTDAMTVLKLQLMLAQTYLEDGQQRNAAACYWHLLRHPHHLTPAVLRGITSNLLRCRPGIHTSLQARLRRIVAEQEEVMADAASLQSTLSALG